MSQLRSTSSNPHPPRLLDQVRSLAMAKFGRPEPGERFAEWIKRYVLFHNTRHPRELGRKEIDEFLRHIVATEREALRAGEFAFEAILFLYGDVLRLNVGEIVIPKPPKLLDQLRYALRARHYSPRTEECYTTWVERFIRFHGMRHPRDMGGAEVETFLTNLAVAGHVAASTQNLAGKWPGRLRRAAFCMQCWLGRMRVLVDTCARGTLGVGIRKNAGVLRVLRRIESATRSWHCH